MKIREQFGDLTRKRLFDFIPLDEDTPRQQELIKTWKTFFQNKRVPFVIVESENNRHSKYYPLMTALYKEKLVGEMTRTCSLESLIDG